MLRTACRDSCRGLAEHSVDVVLDVRTKRREGVAATQSAIPRPRREVPFGFDLPAGRTRGRRTWSITSARSVCLRLAPTSNH